MSARGNVEFAAAGAHELLEAVERAGKLCKEPLRAAAVELTRVIELCDVALKIEDDAAPHVERFERARDEANEEIGETDLAFRRALAGDELDVGAAESAQLACSRAKLRATWAANHLSRIHGEVDGAARAATAAWGRIHMGQALSAKRFVADLLAHEDAGGADATGIRSRYDWKGQSTESVAHSHASTMSDAIEVGLTVALLAAEKPLRSALEAFAPHAELALQEKADDAARAARRARIATTAAERLGVTA